MFLEQNWRISELEKPRKLRLSDRHAWETSISMRIRRILLHELDDEGVRRYTPHPRARLRASEETSHVHEKNEAQGREQVSSILDTTHWINRVFRQRFYEDCAPFYWGRNVG